jgi:hypothetical protein
MAFVTPTNVTVGSVLTASKYNQEVVDNGIAGHPLVSSLPASPADGDTVYLQTAAMATDGIIWTFRYRSGAGTYKWEFVGGPPWAVEVATGQTQATNNAWVDLATVGPSVTVPVAGDYITVGMARAENGFAGANRSFIGVAIGAGTPTHDAQADIAAQNHLESLSITDIQTATAGQEFRLRYRQVNNGLTFAYRTLLVTPRAVS